MRQLITAFMHDESGATAIEYGLIIGLIAVVILTALGELGKALNTKFNNVADGLS